MYAGLDLLQIKVIFLFKIYKKTWNIFMFDRSKTIFPEQIRCVAVTAPAGTAAPEAVSPAIKMLEQHLTVKNYIARPTADTPQYLAGLPEQRAELFNRAVNDSEVDLILALRGGFGSVHILQEIDYATLRKRNLPVMGYSDITSLHCAMLAKNAGVPIAGSNLMQQGEVFADDLSFSSHKLALQKNISKTVLAAPAIKAVNELAAAQRVSGKACAANLTVLASLCGTEFMPDFSNRILIIEDVNEPIYKLDRLLHQLYLSGVLKDLQALVFGRFTGGENSPEVLDKLFASFSAKLPCPCYQDFAFGHEFPMIAVNSNHTLTLQNNHAPVFSAAT